MRFQFCLMLLGLAFLSACGGQTVGGLYDQWQKSSQAQAQENLYPAGQLPPPPPAQGGVRPQPPSLKPAADDWSQPAPGTPPAPAQVAPASEAATGPVSQFLFSQMQPQAQAPAPYQPSQELQPYNQAGGVSMATAKRLIGGEFAKPQPQRAMRSLLGSPNWFSETREVFVITNSGDGVTANRKLIIEYNDRTNEAINWFIQ